MISKLLLSILKNSFEITVILLTVSFVNWHLHPLSCFWGSYIYDYRTTLSTNKLRNLFAHWVCLVARWTLKQFSMILNIRSEIENDQVFS